MFDKNQNKILLTSAVILTAVFTQNVLEAGKSDHIKMEKVGTSELNRITLTPKSADRLGIKLSKVGEDPMDADDVKENKIIRKRKTVPYSALYYDMKGNTWVYTNPEPLVFVRQSIIVEDMDDDDSVAVFSNGPPIGTDVVTIGVAELYGAEMGMGK